MKRFMLFLLAPLLVSSCSGAEADVQTREARPLDKAQSSEARPERQRRGPPPEALEACVNAAEKSACVVTTPRGQLSGMCEKMRDQETLACRPEGRERGGPRPNSDREGNRPENRSGERYENRPQNRDETRSEARPERPRGDRPERPRGDRPE